MSEYPPKGALAHKEPLTEDFSVSENKFANDDEVVFTAPARTIEAANDNEIGYSQPKSHVEAANDNTAVTTIEEEKRKGVLERLGMTHTEEEVTSSQAEMAAEEITVPESVEPHAAESMEKGHTDKAESSTSNSAPAASAGGEKKKDGGNTGGGEASGHGASKKKMPKWLSWVWKPVKWAAMAFGALFALGMTTVLKLTDQAMKQSGGKGGGGGAKKPAGGGGGHH